MRTVLAWLSLAFLFMAGCDPLAQQGGNAGGGGAPAGGVAPSTPGGPGMGMPGMGGPPGMGMPGTPGQGQLWVVLSNFQASRGGIDASFSCDYRVASGSFQPGAKYVLVVEKSGFGPTSDLLFIDIDSSKTSGRVEGGTRGSMAFGPGSLTAYVARQNRDQIIGFVQDSDLTKVSGEIKLGEAQSAANPPNVTTSSPTDPFGQGGSAPPAGFPGTPPGGFPGGPPGTPPPTGLPGGGPPGAPPAGPPGGFPPPG